MIKFLVMDVDGTLTDGKLYIGNDGEMFKAFDVKDGCGIKDILPDYSIEPIIITARKSKILENRCNELNITNYHQGVREKYQKLLEIIEEHNKNNGTDYSLENCAYIGDDILDLKCMIPIKEEGGIIGCPSDSVKDVISVSHFISKYNGGNGAVREFIEWIVEKNDNI